MSVRDLLLVYDYTDAVSLLMKLPSNISVSFIVSFALHLKAGVVTIYYSRRPSPCVPVLISTFVQRKTGIIKSLRKGKMSNRERKMNEAKR
jgi:hypothetical protein